MLEFDIMLFLFFKLFRKVLVLSTELFSVLMEIFLFVVIILKQHYWGQFSQCQSSQRKDEYEDLDGLYGELRIVYQLLFQQSSQYQNQLTILKMKQWQLQKEELEKTIKKNRNDAKSKNNSNLCNYDCIKCLHHLSPDQVKIILSVSDILTKDQKENNSTNNSNILESSIKKQNILMQKQLFDPYQYFRPRSQLNFQTKAYQSSKSGQQQVIKKQPGTKKIISLSNKKLCKVKQQIQSESKSNKKIFLNNQASLSLPKKNLSHQKHNSLLVSNISTINFSYNDDKTDNDTNQVIKISVCDSLCSKHYPNQKENLKKVERENNARRISPSKQVKVSKENYYNLKINHINQVRLKLKIKPKH